MTHMERLRELVTAAYEALGEIGPDKRRPFTRAQAIAEAKKKAESFGQLSRAGLDSLVRDWEAQERPAHGLGAVEE